MRFSWPSVVGFGLLSCLLCSTGGVLGKVVTRNVNVKVMERTGDKLFEKSLEYPKAFTQTPKVKSNTPLTVTFDALTGDDKPLGLDQAFVSFQHTETGNEVAFPAKMSKKGSYKMDLTRRLYRRNFGGASGTYNIALILGSFEEGGLYYKLGNINISPAVKAAARGSSAQEVKYEAKEEIHHKFADPQKMPNVGVSLVFTAMVVAPLLALFATWAKLGVNTRNLKKEPVGSAVFLGLIAVYMSLAIAYWIGLKLFPTLTYAIFLALPTYMAGQYALSKRIEKKI
ncbi:proteasome regulatory particle base subunit [Dipsacomyces acuminosporus]|nr:proteasome regulatory particle base subunit [Dipsacomyces acuminosporus]